ncbi:hypothetical protein [Fusobacterium nucleatum]|uniref:hypothetical protein n=1 Tax=Fusobacterium nucleatum TaxID=851 RepID=UPI0030D492F4
MLEQLTLAFKVIGDGLDSLKKIDAQIDALKNSMNNAKNSISSAFSSLKSKINSVKQSIINFKNKISSAFSALKAKITANFPAISKLRNGFIALRRGLGNFGNYAQQQFQNSQNKASSFWGILRRIAATLAAGFTIKTAIEGAGNIEQYRNTLETVLKDSDMARKKLAWASRFANKTPFETEEVVGGMTKLQSYGIEGDRILKTTNRTYLEMIGDMASGMGKSFDQAIEAIADARTGELERLKEFGITKNMIAEFGKSKGLEIFNSKGQINDLELFNKTLFEMMDSRFGGAMEKQAKTFKGGLSTISGAAKSALSTLAGVNEFGDIVENSPFQILRDKVIIPFANTLVRLQEDGTFTRWAENLSNIFGEIINIGGRVIDFIVKWKEVLIPLASAITGLFVINKVIVLIGALKTALSAFSFNPIMLGIGAVIAIGVLLYRNWDLIKAKLASLWAKIKAFAKALWDIGKKIFMWLSPIGLIITVGKLIIQNWDLIKAKFTELGSYLYNKILGIGNFFVGLRDKAVDVFFKLIDKLKEVWETMKSTAASAFDFILDYVAKIWENIKGFFSNLGQKIKSLPGISWFFDDSGEKKTTTERVYFEDTPVIDGTHKTGLDYVPFDGYIAELHKGERVLTAEENNAYSNAENNSFSDIKSSTNTKNSNKTDKRVILNITINMPTTAKAETDWNRVGEMIAEKLEDFMLQNEIAKGDI